MKKGKGNYGAKRSVDSKPLPNPHPRTEGWGDPNSLKKSKKK